MKKVLAEVINQPTISELETRISVLEARLEKLDPTPKRETLQPYPIGSQVYSVADLEGRHPLVVRGYDRPGCVLVTVLPGEPERSLPIKSVRPLQECPRAQPSPGEAFANMADPKAREFLEGRQKAQIEAATKPFTAPIPEQRRYS